MFGQLKINTYICNPTPANSAYGQQRKAQSKERT